MELAIWLIGVGICLVIGACITVIYATGTVWGQPIDWNYIDGEEVGAGIFFTLLVSLFWPLVLALALIAGTLLGLTVLINKAVGTILNSRKGKHVK